MDDFLRRLQASPVTIYPNPANKFLTIEYISNRTAMLQSTIIDGFGKAVISNQTSLIAGVNKINVNIAGMPAGLYNIVLFNTATQEKIIKKLIIN
jgi:hypothetical protein